MARLDDGHSTLLTFAANSSVKFYEKTVTPPGIKGGGPNDTTTMHNVDWRTHAPKKLKTLSEGSASVAYDTAVYTQILAMINVNQLITIHFPDGSTYAFWGWVDEFTPGAIKEGEQPVAEVKIQPSNQNDSDVEENPVYTGP